MKKYISTGLVFGNFWGGGKGAYTAERLENATLDGLLKEANEQLESGALDAGMGYESLIGALLNIQEIDTKVIDGKEYTNIEYHTEYIGELSDDEIDFLEEVSSC